MNIIVQKFGGTSVANFERIIKITNIVSSELDKGNKLVLVISAMAGVTNTLLSQCKEISHLISKQELELADFIISNGENISSGLTALALQHRGIKAIPLQGWQVPIHTNDQPSKSLITNINRSTILTYLDEGFVPVICGFQGVNRYNKITTLGRGGSDITAVAIAAALNSARCDIYTDVTGVYSADPRLIPEANKIPVIGYDTMLEFSYSGAKVLHPRSVEIAKEFKLDLRVISSFDNIQGTQIIDDSNMELSKIVGITQNKNILLTKIYTDLGLNSVLSSIVEAGIHIQNSYIEGNIVILITAIEELNRLSKELNNLCDQQIVKHFHIRTDVIMVNVIGNRLLNENGLPSRILKIIADFNIQAFHIDHAKISILTEESHSEILVKQLHESLIDDPVTN
jgi:aspartate kinase